MRILKILLVLCSLALIAAAPAPKSAPPSAKPAAPKTVEALPKRVLLISIDTLRYDYLSCYGNERVETPHIDSLSERGVTFDHAVAQIPLTLPSHTSILTGLYPTHHGVHDNGGFYLDPKLTTLAEIFKVQGFATAGFIAGFPLDSRFGINQGFDFYDDKLPVRTANLDVAMPQIPGDRVVDDVLGWLKASRTSKWFLWLHLYDPHHPYFPPEPYRAKYPRNFYAGEVGFVDDQLGRVFDYLTAKGLMDSTLVVFVADHGESLGAHKERTHGIFAYETTLHIPLIFAGPGVPKGPRVPTLVRSIDIAPTILSLMKFPPDRNMDGVSLVDYWKAGSNRTGLQTFFEALSVNLDRNWAPIRGFYSGDYKYIEVPVPELYNLKDDPSEQNNLCGQDQNLCSKYRDDYQQFARMVGVTDVVAQDIDPDTAEKLQALGYTASTKRTPTKTTYTVADDPKNLVEIDNLMDDALSSHRKKDEAQAIRLMEQVIARRPDLTMAYLHLAFFYDDFGQTDKAMTTLQKAVSNKVEDAQVYARLGLYFQKLGRYDDAVAAGKKGIELDPRDVESYNFLGMSYTNAGQFDPALKVFQDALALDSTVAITYNNMGVLYLKQKQYPSALKNFQTAVKYDPQLAAAFNGMGVVYASTNQQQLAIAQWRKAIDADATQIDALLNIGYAYLKLKQKEPAVQAFQEFLEKAHPEIYRDEILKVQDVLQKIQS
jgi:tetratricopeptide (TPR) repeat protein